MAKSAKTKKEVVAEPPAPKKSSKKAEPRIEPSIEEMELKPVETFSRFSEFDIYLCKSGKHYKLYEKLGSHVAEHKGVIGTYFAVWAPNAEYVSVIGNFNGWERGSHPLSSRWDGSGIWEGFVPNIGRGEVYKYFIKSHIQGKELEKADPFALWCEIAPKTASVVWDTWYEWKDEEWMRERRKNNALNAPMSVYEVHLASWIRDPSEPERFLSFQEIAEAMVPYVKEMGFTHVEFMPSWKPPIHLRGGIKLRAIFPALPAWALPKI